MDAAQKLEEARLTLFELINSEGASAKEIWRKASPHALDIMDEVAAGNRAPKGSGKLIFDTLKGIHR